MGAHYESDNKHGLLLHPHNVAHASIHPVCSQAACSRHALFSAEPAVMTATAAALLLSSVYWRMLRSMSGQLVLAVQLLSTPNAHSVRCN